LVIEFIGDDKVVLEKLGIYTEERKMEKVGY